jgi:hypothetical protein
MAAHRSYRRGENQSAIAEAAKSFESTLKAVCKEHGWVYPENATTIPLIKVVMEQGLIPSYLLTHFTSLRAVLESGLPAVANRNGRHGQGRDAVAVPDYLAAYVLHLAAANISWLVQASHNLIDETDSDEVPF